MAHASSERHVRSMPLMAAGTRLAADGCKINVFSFSVNQSAREVIDGHAGAWPSLREAVAPNDLRWMTGWTF